MNRPVPDCEVCAGTGFLDVGKTKPCSCLHDGLTDAELIALSSLAVCNMLTAQIIEGHRRAVGVNDAGTIVHEYAEGQDQLRAELVRRGVL